MTSFTFNETKNDLSFAPIEKTTAVISELSNALRLHCCWFSGFIMKQNVGWETTSKEVENRLNSALLISFEFTTAFNTLR